MRTDVGGLIAESGPALNQRRPGSDSAYVGTPPSAGTIIGTGGGDRIGDDPGRRLAHAVALAHLLPHLKEEGRAGLARLQVVREVPPHPAEVPELARMLVDADPMGRLLQSGVPARAQ